MKRFLIALMALCATMFVGCSENTENKEGAVNGGSSINGTSIVGTWACIEVYIEDSDTWEKFEEVDYLIVFDDKTIADFYGKDWYEFRDGYLYGCSMQDFEEDERYMYSIEDGCLYLGGMNAGPVKIENGYLIWGDNHSFNNYDKYQRVKGFR